MTIPDAWYSKDTILWTGIVPYRFVADVSLNA
jgi:hypothetical protein